MYYPDQRMHPNDQRVDQVKTDCPKCGKKRAICSVAHWGPGIQDQTGSWTHIRIVRGCYRCGWRRRHGAYRNY
jgi:ribosomal protein S14